LNDPCHPDVSKSPRGKLGPESRFLRLQYAICQKRFPVLVQKISRALPPVAPPLTFCGRLPFFHSFVQELSGRFRLEVLAAFLFFREASGVFSLRIQFLAARRAPSEDSRPAGAVVTRQLAEAPAAPSCAVDEGGTGTHT